MPSKPRPRPRRLTLAKRDRAYDALGAVLEADDVAEYLNASERADLMRARAVLTNATNALARAAVTRR